ncbi:MAG: CPBP family glutamic-type intramembrane protease [Pseudomonadota bacterium]
MFEVLRQYTPNGAPDRSTLGWLLLPALVAFCLLAFDRFGIEHKFAQMFGASLAAAGHDDNQIRFFAQLWLSGSCVVLMVVLPTLFLWTFPEDHAWGLRGGQLKAHLPIYALLMLIMLPVLWWVAGGGEFQTFYPMYDPRSLQMWLLFEAAYLTQFFCVEYFFRGPILFRLHARFGYAAIGMLVVPYALIHIYKPFPEAIGSIIAGLLLGFLALKARSIWLGVLLHCGVAFTMDTFALLRSGRFAQLLGG